VERRVERRYGGRLGGLKNIRILASFNPWEPSETTDGSGAYVQGELKGGGGREIASIQTTLGKLTTSNVFDPSFEQWFPLKFSSPNGVGLVLLLSRGVSLAIACAGLYPTLLSSRLWDDRLRSIRRIN
jgi:hypothetical protein